MRDKLIAAENHKQWEKKMKVWSAEEDARVALMYEVYGDRDNKLQERSNPPIHCVMIVNML